MEQIFRSKLAEIIKEDLETKVERAFRNAGRGSTSKIFHRARKDVRSLNVTFEGKGSYRPLTIQEDDDLELHTVDVS